MDKLVNYKGGLYGWFEAEYNVRKRFVPWSICPHIWPQPMWRNVWLWSRILRCCI